MRNVPLPLTRHTCTRGRTSFGIPALHRVLLDLAPLTRSISLLPLYLLRGHSTVSYELCFPLRLPSSPPLSSLPLSPLLLRTLDDRGKRKRERKREAVTDDIKAAFSSPLLSSLCQTTLPLLLAQEGEGPSLGKRHVAQTMGEKLRRDTYGLWRPARAFCYIWKEKLFIFKSPPPVYF